MGYLNDFIIFIKNGWVFKVGFFVINENLKWFRCIYVFYFEYLIFYLLGIFDF